MGLFDDIKDTIKQIGESKEVFDKIKEGLDNANISIPDIARNAALNANPYINVSELEIDWKKNLTDEKKENDFISAIFSHRLTKPTNFFITDDDFDDASVFNVYLYSPNGERLEAYSGKNMEETAGIYFGLRNCNCEPENPEKLNGYLEYYNAGRPIVEKKDGKYLKYRIHGESDFVYFDCHLYEVGRVDSEILLIINKQALNKEQIQSVLNEYYAIINTLEIREVEL